MSQFKKIIIAKELLHLESLFTMMPQKLRCVATHPSLYFLHLHIRNILFHLSKFFINIFKGSYKTFGTY